MCHNQSMLKQRPSTAKGKKNVKISMIVDLSISPLRSVNLCFMYFEVISPTHLNLVNF